MYATTNSSETSNATALQAQRPLNTTPLYVARGFSIVGGSALERGKGFVQAVRLEHGQQIDCQPPRHLRHGQPPFPQFGGDSDADPRGGSNPG
ncbi:MAG TPA: hypothetical protein VH277_11035 [Gemmatimonadaceae bacterium]|nr:hypothetical protein [Gemmatimonadaceae bacterium]